VGFNAGGQITGTISDANGSFSVNGEAAGNAVSAYGIYPFTISPIPDTEAINTPQGIGFGYMYVRPSGAVLIVGRLGDGAEFSTASTISGTSVPVYANLYHSSGGVLAGILNFQDIPNVSDCAGTLYWSRPAINSSSLYSAGFQTSTQFAAAQFNPFISELNDDAVRVDVTQYDGSEFATDVTLHYRNGFIPVYEGEGSGNGPLILSLAPIGDAFSGIFLDPWTDKWATFSGILLPKSRTGAGMFFSDGRSGSVNIQY
jgi:hypothetical protein